MGAPRVKVGRILKYSTMPGLIPRIREFVESGFSHLSFFMAHVYRGVRLLPAHHPYLSPHNMGRYSVWNVIGEARRNLVVKWENIDQVLVFSALFVGVVLMFLQFGAFLLTMVMPGAWAASPYMPYNWTWSQFFVTTTPANDIAFMTLDRVFGLPGIYNSSVAMTGPFPNAFQTGLQDLFSYYSLGVFAIGIVIIIYYVITIIGETAQTGTPFGRRYNHAWVPVRLMLAIALLAPIWMGMNIAQLGTLRVAKWGSSMATNGWILFNERLLNPGSASAIGATTSTVAGTNIAGAAVWDKSGAGPAGGVGPGSDQPSLIAKPYTPSINTFPELIFVAKTCMYMHRMIYDRYIDAYIVPGPIQDRAAGTATSANSSVGLGNPSGWAGWILSSLNSLLSSLGRGGVRTIQTGAIWAGLVGASYQDALTMADNGDIRIVFGEQDSTYYSMYPGGVRPFCGQLILHTTSVDPNGGSQDGAYYMQETYFNEIIYLWLDNDFDQNALGIAKRFTPTEDKDPASTLDRCFAIVYLDFLKTSLETETLTARQMQISDTDWDDYARLFGWAGAAMWYNKIAQYNGRFFTAYYNLPTPLSYPEVMETVKGQRSENEEQMHSRYRYMPYNTRGDDATPNTAIEFNDQADFYIAQALYYAQSMFNDAYIESQENPILDYIHMIFGTSGLFNMRENIDLGVHPMAALVGIGSALIESTMINLGASILGGAMGGLGMISDSSILKSLGAAVSNVTFIIAMIGLSIGFILFYVIPFMPFIYFFFAFGGWVKAVFEAMVGLPLWALAHLRINGEGINGPMAMDGFYLVLEIFVRPIVIVFSLIASMAIFSAMVAVLNDIWEIVIINLTGSSLQAIGSTTHGSCSITPSATPSYSGTFMTYARNMIDFLFYTVIYAIFVYMIGMSSFKLIDLIPNYILRWMGKSLKTLGEGDLSDDPGQNLLSNMYIGSQSLMNQIGQGGGGFIGMLMGRN